MENRDYRKRHFVPVAPFASCTFEAATLFMPQCRFTVGGELAWSYRIGQVDGEGPDADHTTQQPGAGNARGPVASRFPMFTPILMLHE
jgi:hypothetical protein